MKKFKLKYACRMKKILPMYIHGLTLSSEEHGEREESGQVAACVYNKDRQMGKENFKSCYVEQKGKKTHGHGQQCGDCGGEGGIRKFNSNGKKNTTKKVF